MQTPTTTAAPTQAQTRILTFEIEGRASDDAIPVVVSSDAVVEVSDGPEVLVHSTDAIDLQRAPLPIIATHRGGQVNVGLVDELRIVNGQLRGMARFGVRQEAADYRADVLNRIIRSVSVGYARVQAKYRPDGVLVTSRWLPTHVALVAEPADVRAGFYRDRGDALPEFELQAAEPVAEVSQPAAKAAVTQERSIVTQETNAAAGAHADNSAHRALPAQPNGTTGNRALEMETNRKRGIENLCKAIGIDDGIRDHWIGTGLSVEVISDEALQIQQQRAAANPTSTAKLGLSETESKRYSLMSAIRACADKNWTNAGFELECSREIAKRHNTVLDPNKFYVPFEVQGRSVAATNRSFMTPGAQRQMGRDLTVGTSTAGGHLVGTDNMSFIDVLRNRSVAYRMGARRMSGLVGNVTVPRQTAAATAFWLSTEATAVTESQQTFGQMSLTPKTVGAYTEISRQLMLQSSPDAESIVTGDLGKVAGLALDIGVLRGSGSSGEPTGIINTGGIGSVAGAGFIAAAFARVLEFQTDVATANVEPNRGGYVTTPGVAASMMQAVKFPSTASPVWEGNIFDGAMCGYAAMSSNQMSAATMLYGDWDQVVIAEWGVLQIEVNPYANFQAGIIGVRAMVSVDVGLRYAAAFSYATSIA
jgi:HK97 family phage major capsid protein